MNNVEKGALGERVARNFLESRGHLIMDMNFRTKNGEIDIITKIRSDIHFVEVKLRKNRDYGNASQAVNHKKQGKIRAVAGEYLSERRLFYNEIFFDVVEIYTEEKLINYIESAF